MDGVFSVWESLLDISNKTRMRLDEYKRKYPVLNYHYDLTKNELAELEQVYRTSGPQNRAKKAAHLSAFCYSTMTLLDVMDCEGFSFLGDESMWTLLRIVSEQNLPINNNWIKTLIATNVLELIISDYIKKFDEKEYEKLNRDDGLEKRFQTLNSLLKSRGLGKYALNNVNFGITKVTRNMVDHPEPNTVSNIAENHAKSTIEYAIYALKQLKEAFDEFKTLK